MRARGLVGVGLWVGLLGCSEGPRTEGQAPALASRSEALVVSQKDVLSAPAKGNFASSLALSGDTLAVGAPTATFSGAYRAGGVYIHVRNGNGWTLQTTLQGATELAGFGQSVALAGDTLLVGIRGGSGAGSAAVYARSGGTWAQQATLAASDGFPVNVFGSSVALSDDGTTAFVGALADDKAGTQAGAVYVFEHSGGSWSQKAKFVRADSTSTQLGRTMAYSDGTLVAAGWGIALFLTRSGGTWSKQSEFPGYGNYYGSAILGDVAMTGGMMNGNDRVQVYARSGGVWTKTTTITAPAGSQNPGYSVALAKDFAILGDPSDSNFEGAFYVFSKAGTNWVQSSKIKTPLNLNDGERFGSSLALRGPVLVVGGPFANSLGSSGDGNGAAATYGLTGPGEPCAASNECSTGFCADGFCCDKPCDQGCDVCSKSLGSSADGTCSFAPKGSSCGAGSSCSGASASCPSSCASDSDCLDTHFCTPIGACVPRKSLGETCSTAAGADCKQDGCRVCSSGFCSGGLCCDGACSGACTTCSQAQGAPKDGTCGPASAGQPGSPACSDGLACNGSASACPSACFKDEQCSPDRYCAPGGKCLPRKPQGAVCDAAAGKDCQEASCRVCSTGFCSDGFCCNQACDAPCDVCAAANGAPSDGMCGPAKASYPGSPACGQGNCDGKSAACPGGCSADAQCQPEQWCNAKTSACEADQAEGASCTDSSQCKSGFCVDGVCCTSACTEACQACSKEKKGFGQDGQCGNISFGKDPDDDCPTDPEASCQFAGACDGKGACQLYENGTVAEPARCLSEDTSQPARVCDGAGQKSPPDNKPCAPFVCDGTLGTCKIKCNGNADCSTGATCAANGQCTTAGGSCADAVTAKGPDGTQTDCRPYTCLNGQCRDACAKSSECADGFDCVEQKCQKQGAGGAGASGSAGSGQGGSSSSGAGGQGGAGAGGASAPAPAEASDDGGCGCRSAGSGQPGALPAALLAVAAAARRRRRSA